MDYKKQIENKKALNSLVSKLTTFVKTADETIREIASDAEVKFKETTDSFMDSLQTNNMLSFRKNIQSLAIEYVEKELIKNGTNGCNTITIGIKENGTYLAIEQIVYDLCKEYKQPFEFYSTDVYYYNLFGSLVLFFSTNEQIIFTKVDTAVFSISLKEDNNDNLQEEGIKLDIEKDICECEVPFNQTHTPCSCDTNCDDTCECMCHKNINLNMNK